MCLYIVDNVSTCRIIYFRYVDTEKLSNLNAIFEYRVGHFGTRDSNFSGETRIPGSRAQPYCNSLGTLRCVKVSGVNNTDTCTHDAFLTPLARFWTPLFELNACLMCSDFVF